MQRAIAAAFLAFLVCVPLWDATRPGAFEWRVRTAALASQRASSDEVDLFSALFPGVPPGSAFEAFERDLEASSQFRSTLRPRVQRFLTRRLGRGNARVLVGPGGSLLHRPSFEYVVGPAFDARPERALLRWRDRLAERGIELLVVPVPAKASACGGSIVRNEAWTEFVANLRRAGVPVLELAPTYLRTDTHWTPEAMERAAAAIATAIPDRARPDPATADLGAPVHPLAVLDVERVGDLGRLLDERSDARWLEPDEVTIRRVPGWEPDPDSSVLLLGDSFTNIYSLAAMGWGTRAGLAEHLSVELGFDVDRIAINGDGARASREALRLAGPRRLDTKRVVVFQFAARELRYGDWSDVELP